MKTRLLIYVLLASMLVSPLLSAGEPGRKADQSFDVFQPISKYMSTGDAESLSAWFAPTLEIMILDKLNDASRSQALCILQNFFDNYRPRSFEIIHKAGEGNFKYALGRLNASGEHFTVTVFASCQEDKGYRIQQLKIERME